MKSLTGHLLIAPPQERDLDFIGTVILLIQHSEEQAFGLVLNRSTTTTVRQAWQGRSRCKRDEFVYSGGPVSGPLMALHAEPSLGEIEVLPGVYYSVQKEHLEQLIRYPRRPLKIFQSHVGWGPGQLERFLENNPWQIMPATAEHVFHLGPDLGDEVSKLTSEPS
jgi:putative transcriptional regulator